MRILPNRADKLTLLSKIVKGRLSSKEVSDMRKGWEPLRLTLILDDSEDSFAQDSNEPTYHIEVYSDGKSKCYDRYPSGKIEYR